MYPAGGITIEKLVRTGDSSHTLGIGHFTAEAAAKVLDAKCHVPYTMLDIPIGLNATDRFVMALAEKAGVPIPDSIAAERGRVVDIITDMEQYLAGKRVALWGDPDTLIPLTEFLVDLNMQPVYIVSGTPGKYFEERIREITGDSVKGLKVKNGQQADMFLLHQWIENEPVDLLIGNTYGKYIARDEDIPFMRLGFPILDRVGHSYFPQTCYAGCMRLLVKMLDLILDRADRDAPETSFELQM
jgi:nitrogenase molybdenum-iron protein beta chain